tara:strand:- start:605 stop:904 length:300 start_codon:yes stop_codon:yes gene_type:complete
MANFQITYKALEDLASIWEYTLQEWSAEQAEHYYNMLLNTCQHISENPKLGKSYEEITAGLQGLRTKKHIIFYRLIPGQGLEILRILHAQMDLKERLKS